MYYVVTILVASLTIAVSLYYDKHKQVKELQERVNRLELEPIHQEVITLGAVHEVDYYDIYDPNLSQAEIKRRIVSNLKSSILETLENTLQDYIVVTEEDDMTSQVMIYRGMVKVVTVPDTYADDEKEINLKIKEVL